MKHPKYAKVIQLKNRPGEIALESLFKDLQFIQEVIEQNLKSGTTGFCEKNDRNE